MTVEPAPPQRSMDDVRPRVTVTLWPLLTYLVIFDWLLGFVSGMVLFLIGNLAGAPKAVQAAAMLAGIVVWIGSWRRTSIEFTAGECHSTGAAVRGISERAPRGARQRHRGGER